MPFPPRLNESWIMYYRQVKHIFRVSEQKGVWILSYSNLAGAVAGMFLGNALQTWLPFLPTVLAYGLGIGLGVAITFRFHGWPIYLQLFRWARYWLHQRLRPKAYEIDSTTYYAPRSTDDTTLLMPRVYPGALLRFPTHNHRDRKERA